MEEFLEKIIKAEEEAKILLTKTKEQAEEIKSNADREATQRLIEENEKAQIFIKTETTKAIASAEEELKRELEKIKQANDEFAVQKSEKIGLVADKIIKIIIDPLLD